MNAYVCVYVCVCMYECICMYVFAYVWVHVYVYACVPAYFNSINFLSNEIRRINFETYDIHLITIHSFDRFPSYFMILITPLILLYRLINSYILLVCLSAGQGS